MYMIKNIQNRLRTYITKHDFQLATFGALLYFIVFAIYVYYAVIDNDITVIETLICAAIGLGYFKYSASVLYPVLSKHIHAQKFISINAADIYPSIDQYLHTHHPCTLYVSPEVHKTYFSQVQHKWYDRNAKKLFTFDVYIDADMTKYEFGPKPKCVIETIDDFYI